jgi:hypothetical protein
VGTQQTVDEYCRAIETYLCQKNDGHLIRVVGPSFDIVSGWASSGVPLKVAYQGIDRYFERYYAKGSRRRPVKIDFCEADVLDVFDAWRRALGLPAAGSLGRASSAPTSITSTSDESGVGAELARPSSRSLPSHLERAVMRLTQARANGALGASFDDVIDRVARELDAARAGSRGVRGEARQALVARLAELESLDETVRATLAREADAELSGYRAAMASDAFARAREAAIDRLVRERFGLPTITFI